MRTGNDLAELSSILFFVAFCLRVYVTIEQPLCSCLPLFGSMKLVLYFTSSRRYVTHMGTLVDAMIWSIFYFVFFLGVFFLLLDQMQFPIARFKSQGSFGGPSPKPLQLWSTWQRISEMQRERPFMPDADSLVTRDDRGGFTGKKDLLHDSQEYTAAFGRAVTRLCETEWR